MAVLRGFQNSLVACFSNGARERTRRHHSRRQVKTEDNYIACQHVGPRCDRDDGGGGIVESVGICPAGLHSGNSRHRIASCFEGQHHKKTNHHVLLMSTNVCWREGNTTARTCRAVTQQGKQYYALPPPAASQLPLHLTNLCTLLLLMHTVCPCPQHQ